MALILVASILNVIGVCLPWVNATISGPLGQMAVSKSGFELQQGVISVAVAIASAVLGAAGGRAIPRKVVGCLVIVASVAIVTLALGVMTNPNSGSFGPYVARASLGAGLFASLAGGVLLFIGGVAAFRAE